MSAEVCELVLSLLAPGASTAVLPDALRADVVQADDVGCLLDAEAPRTCKWRRAIGGGRVADRGQAAPLFARGNGAGTDACTEGLQASACRPCGFEAQKGDTTRGGRFDPRAELGFVAFCPGATVAPREPRGRFVFNPPAVV